ncbi:hypothetical protein CORT_0B04870 [Candida orthopsilosis Co 90-125]|uniref:2-dehydropantoate 2-reductase n=1 Tax=Candida orthopsilosis (strain 90-125) TaxID=1136231 RepID=H8X1F5_CANO9|nr:hypothetical protein CORT_0B04870 [Candida orthopsilosis Co 90-125]CCG22195.1 hypothetical protein CORT_0B04870 [Candida orthopsilosis Co 90-125]
MGKPKVLVIGSGGVGTISAVSLKHNNQSEVTLVVRSDYDLIKSQGYSINSCTYGELTNWQPHNLAQSVEDALERFGPFDYILLTTKNIPDGPVTCEDIISPAIKTGDEVIILLQNGINIEKTMLERFPGHLILSGVSLIASTYHHGHVENKGQDIVFLGDFVKPSTHPLSKAKIDEFISIYNNPGFNKIIIDEDVQKTRWEKLIYNSTFNTITALVDLDATRLQINNANEELLRPAMNEVIAIAKSVGVECDASKIELLIHIGDGLFYAPSMCVDMRKKQLMELEIILGNPIRIAKESGVATPVLSVIYSLLKMVQFRLKEERKMFSINENDFRGNSDEYPKIFEQKYIH